LYGENGKIASPKETAQFRFFLVKIKKFQKNEKNDSLKRQKSTFFKYKVLFFNGKRIKIQKILYLSANLSFFT